MKQTVGALSLLICSQKNAARTEGRAAFLLDAAMLTTDPAINADGADLNYWGTFNACPF
jgi:hypothetical protein